jgi:hypothetical protein
VWIVLPLAAAVADEKFVTVHVNPLDEGRPILVAGLCSLP